MPVETLLSLAFANCSIRGGGQGLKCAEKLLRLAMKKSACGESCNRRHCAGEFVGQGTNGRATRKVFVNKLRGNGEDQAGLNQRIRWVGEKVGKGQPVARHRRNRSLHAIAGKIDPLQQMSYLVSANTEHNLQDFNARCL